MTRPEEESGALRQARKDAELTTSADPVRAYLKQIGKVGFPRLGVLRRLRPIPDRSAVDAPSPTIPAGRGRQGETRNGSRVRCDSLVEVGARLCPCGLAASTPQTFLAASLAAHAYRLGSSPPTHSAGARRSRPKSTRFRAGAA
ncbi:MAG: hypothetical protein M3Y48_24270 [Actinomycetota bacterium]|nr:hypothetical protein [Actinomycetota bacterium]